MNEIGTESINHLSCKGRRKNQNKQNFVQFNETKEQNISKSQFFSNNNSKNMAHADKCGYCGRQSHDKSQFPARGKECNKCKKLNHFALVCRHETAQKDSLREKRKTIKPQSFNRDEWKQSLSTQKIRMLENNLENGSTYTVNSDEYNEFVRYKKCQWLGAINTQQGNAISLEKPNSIARLNGGPRVEIELNGKMLNF